MGNRVMATGFAVSWSFVCVVSCSSFSGSESSSSGDNPPAMTDAGVEATVSDAFSPDAGDDIIVYTTSFHLEDPCDGWIPHGDVSVARVVDPDGRDACQLCANNSGEDYIFFELDMQKLGSKLTPGTYEASVYARLPNLSPAAVGAVGFQFDHDNGAHTVLGAPVTTSNAWTSAAGTRDVTLQIRKARATLEVDWKTDSPGKQCLLFDDYVLKKL